jgi:hypothetical protein
MDRRLDGMITWYVPSGRNEQVYPGDYAEVRACLIISIILLKA